MVKTSFLIFLLILIGCESPNQPPLVCNCKLEITSTLTTNQDSIYTLEFNHDLIQTYTRLDVSTECGLHTKVSWDTDYQYRINTDWVSLVNPSSMTDEYGNGSIIFGVWEDFIGKTITIYGGYTDDCMNHHLDSIFIKIN